MARWAEPLRDGIARAVAANLAHSLDTGRVSSRAQSGMGEADYRVLMDVQRFDSMPGESAVLEVMWTVRREKNGELRTGNARIREPIPGSSYQELVAAHARALDTVSGKIAEAIVGRIILFRPGLFALCLLFSILTFGLPIATGLVLQAFFDALIDRIAC